MNEAKHQKFKRLAKLRGDRILKDLRLLGNLSNKNNYYYDQKEVNAIFSTIEEELKHSKMRFTGKQKRTIRL